MTWVVVLMAGCGVVESNLDVAVDPGATEQVVVDVPRGATMRSLGDELHGLGVVSSAPSWELYLRLSGQGACLKAGRHEVSPAMPLSRLVEVLCGAPLPEDVPWVVVEGWRIREIDADLAARGWAPAGAYAAAAADPARFRLPLELPQGTPNLEGLLFPETYAVAPGRLSVHALIQRQLDTFGEVWGALTAQAEPARDAYAVLVMASMVEREEPTPSQRSLVAGILWKRLDAGWNLGVDATSRYELAEWNDRQAFLRQLRDPTDPYNTRLRPGLPPTPIGNPGRAALEAALRPVPSDFWYYLHDGQRVLHPSRNAAEHERLRARYGVY